MVQIFSFLCNCGNAKEGRKNVRWPNRISRPGAREELVVWVGWLQFSCVRSFLKIGLKMIALKRDSLLQLRFKGLAGQINCVRGTLRPNRARIFALHSGFLEQSLKNPLSDLLSALHRHIHFYFFISHFRRPRGFPFDADKRSQQSHFAKQVDRSLSEAAHSSPCRTNYSRRNDKTEYTTLKSLLGYRIPHSNYVTFASSCRPLLVRAPGVLLAACFLSMINL